MDDDDDDVLPDDGDELVIPAAPVAPAAASAQAKESPEEDEEEEEDLVPDEDEEEPEEADLEDRVFANLPASSESYEDLVPDGWSICEQQDTPSLADRVLVYCWENWSCGVVTTKYERSARRPACAVSQGSRATVCVHWPSERMDTDEVPHSYFHLTKNNYYVDGAMLSEPAWLILKQDAAQGVLK